MKLLKLLLSEIILVSLLLINERAINIKMTNVTSLTYLDIDCIVKRWKNICHFTLGQEEDLSDLFTFSINVLILMAVYRPQQVYDPRKKHRIFVFEKVYRFIGVIVDRHQ